MKFPAGNIYFLTSFFLSMGDAALVAWFGQKDPFKDTFRHLFL
jgi:hypothetical protein